MLKSITRRTWSVLIALVMVWTTFCIGQPLTASANVASSTDSAVTGVYFVVPEAIYLKPTWDSYYEQSQQQMSFQWYINNILDSAGNVTLRTGEESSGSLYFRYANAKTSSITLKFEWLNASGGAAAGGNIKIAGTDRPAGTAIPISSSNDAIAITAGTSPSMLGTQSGAYIRWTVTYTDTTDGRQKTVQAYTYVYKPYVQPVGVALRTLNDRGSNHYGSNLAWICGVHGTYMSTNTNENGTLYPKYTADHGLVAISSSDKQGGSAPVIGSLYAQIGDRFYMPTKNESPGNWLSGTQSPAYLPDKSFRSVNNADTGPSGGDIARRTLGYSATGLLTVDLSRYTNLSQIPNLSVGLMVTDDEDSSTGAAYFISNYSGSPATADVATNASSWTDAYALWNNYNECNGDIFDGDTGNGPSTPDSRTASEGEGIKYNGRWKKSISSATAGTSNYYVGAGYHNHQNSDTIWNIAELRVKVTRYNKNNLRNAVKNAISKSPTMQGIFYDMSSTAWTNYTNLYHAACRGLTKVDGSFEYTVSGTKYTNPDTLATALNNAVDKLLSNSSDNGRKTGLNAVQTNIVIRARGDGSYAFTRFPSGYAMSHTAQFKSYDTVTFSPDTVPGYTFIGLKEKTGVETFSEGADAGYPDSFTTSATGATFSNGTVTYKHTDTSGNIYYSYYYAANTYKVHFSPNATGTTGSMADQTFTYSVAQNLTANSFVRPGFSFLGWATSSGGSVEYADCENVNNLSTKDNGTVNLYAKWTTESYTVVFNAAGGTVEGAATLSYSVGSSITMPNATYSGYTLTAWRANNGGNWGPLTYNAGDTVSGKYGDVEFTAIWNANTYKVAFDPNGGTGTAMAEQSFTYGQAQNLNANAFSRSGFEFGGWARSSTATSPEFSDKESVQNLTTGQGVTVTLYAVWTTNGYSITYSTEGGIIRDTSYTRSYTVDDSITLPTNLEKTGYTFAGWKPTSSIGNWNSDTTYSGTVAPGMVGSVSLLAQWGMIPYVITYVYDGTIVGTRYTTDYDITTSITLPSAKLTGYSFGGWQADGSGNWGDTVYKAGGSTVQGTPGTGRYGNVTLTAKWTGVQYYIQFNGNGSTGGTMYNQSYTYGVEGTLPLNEYVRNGYIFLGWALSSSATSETYRDGGTVLNLSPTAAATVTLYAIWQKDTFTISYDPGEGTITTPGATSYTVTDNVLMPIARRTGYTLSGWNPQTDSGSWRTWETYSGTVPAGCYGNVALVARWEMDTYTITYEADGGILSGSYTTEYDLETTIILPTVTRQGYTFGGWRASSAWNGILITGSTVPAGKLGNVTLTAQWASKSYIVHYDANGGSGMMNNQLMRFDESQALTLNSFYRDGYYFSGWAMTPNGATVFADGDTVRNLTQTEGATVDLYAVWTGRNFSIAYNLNGASGSMRATSVTMGGSTTLRANTKYLETVINNKPYAFEGWAFSEEEANDGEVAYANEAVFALTDSVLEQAEVDWEATKPIITLYAVWRLNNLETVTFDLNGAESGTTPADMLLEVDIEVDAANFPDGADFVKTGFIFVGWALTADATTAITAYTPSTIGAVTTLYAVWAADTVELVATEESSTVIDNENNFIYGLEYGLSVDDLKARFVDVLGNGHVEVETQTGMVGTGTVVKVINDYSGNVDATYEIVIFGDLNGDGMLNAADVSAIRSINARLSTYAEGSAQFFAADINSDGMINAADVAKFRSANARLTTLPQTVTTE